MTDRDEQLRALRNQISLIAVEFCRLDLPPYGGFRSLPKDAKWVVEQVLELKRRLEEHHIRGENLDGSCSECESSFGGGDD